MRPKIYVGTMYSGENELAASVTSLHHQQDVDIVHHVIHNKRELEAHQELYGKWNVAKSNFGFDAFMQLDPDTIIYKPTYVKMMYDTLIAAKGYTSIQCPLRDYLTQTDIYGLNMYLPDVVFHLPQDEVFCDRATSNNVTMPFKMLPLELNPVGDHSPNPHFRQAFHFGLHRGLKNRTQQHMQVIDAFRRSGDDRRAMASLGFEMSREFVQSKKTSYTDVEFSEAFYRACLRLEEHKERLVSGT